MTRSVYSLVRNLSTPPEFGVSKHCVSETNWIARVSNASYALVRTPGIILRYMGGGSQFRSF